MQFDPHSINRSNNGLYVTIKNTNIDGQNNPIVIGIYDNLMEAKKAGSNVQGPFFVKRNIFPKPRTLQNPQILQSQKSQMLPFNNFK